ncbi:MAG: fibronectin type III domain-containing protein [Patescibacteria group bacterium]|nr:fibronectin type III domain-containing protein [Patescibacteria group bacterium]
MDTAHFSPVPSATPSPPLQPKAHPVVAESLPGFDEKKKHRFPVSRIIAIAIGTAIGLPLMLVGFIRFQNAFLTRASDSVPRDVVITEVTESTATVHWYTDQETQGTILYGTDPAELRFLSPELAPVKDHTLTIQLLAPDTKYYFVIRIGTEVFTNGGAPWEFTTKGSTMRVSPTPPPGSRCPRTDDCKQIQELLGEGCTVTDYVQCLQKKQ